MVALADWYITTTTPSIGKISCQNYTSTAHSPQRTVKTLTKVEAKMEDGDYERRR